MGPVRGRADLQAAREVHEVVHVDDADLVRGHFRERLREQILAQLLAHPPRQDGRRTRGRRSR
eukprot:1644045-Pyramimonas_sp.AAC.1